MTGSNVLVGGAWGLPYRYIAAMTRPAPSVNLRVIVKSNRNTATTHEMMMDREVANPFRILSANFTTTATISPPSACCITTRKTRGLYAKKNPFSEMALQSFANMPSRAERDPNIPSCTFRSHIEASEPFSIFSKYTPANPEERQDKTTAVNPSSWFCSCEDFSVPLLDSCTVATPTNSVTSDAH